PAFAPPRPAWRGASRRRARRAKAPAAAPLSYPAFFWLFSWRACILGCRKEVYTVAKTKTKPKKKESLPLWDLSHLVPAPERARIDRGLCAAQRAAHPFAKKYRDRLARLSPKAFGRAIAEYEHILARVVRYYSYASLHRQTKLDDPKAGQLYQTVA